MKNQSSFGLMFADVNFCGTAEITGRYGVEMTEQQIWGLITTGGYIDGDGNIDAEDNPETILRLFASHLASISERLSVEEISGLLKVGMLVHRRFSGQ